MACSAAPMSGLQQAVPSRMSTDQIKRKKNQKKQRTKKITPRLASLEKKTPTSVNKSTEWQKYRVDEVAPWVLCAGPVGHGLSTKSALSERVVNGGKSSTKIIWWHGQSRGWTWLIHPGLG